MMAWKEPKTNWQASDVVTANDFNRIEGNIQELQNTKETPAGAQAKADAAAGAVQANLDAHKNEVATQTEYGHIRLSDIPTGIPRGIIVMWSGSINGIPEGWALCDGTNGTPDLRDRFIVGAGKEYNVGATGGAKEVTLSTSQIPSHRHSSGSLSTSSTGSHSHSAGTLSTNSAGSHSHTYSQPTDASGAARDAGGTKFYRDGTSSMSTSSAGSHSHTISGSTSSSGSHSHDVTGYTDYTGSGQAHENRPPYYALAFIMKL